jgi:hypothetical protein
MSLGSIAGCSLGLSPKLEPELENVLEYNARFNENRTERWILNEVRIYDSSGIISEEEFGLILNDLNQIDNVPQMVRGDSDSEIEFKMVKELPKDESGEEPMAETHINSDNGEIKRAEIRISLNRYWYYDRRLPKHELVHALGFRGHTDDGGLMDKKPKSDKITPIVVSTLQELYNLPPGTKLN